MSNMRRILTIFAIFSIQCGVCAGLKVGFFAARQFTLRNTFRTSRLFAGVKSPPVAESTVNSGAPTLLKCESLTKAWTGIPQFEGISLNLAKGQRVGLIGINGAGKSTLLKCLSGIDSADSGRVEVATNTKVIYVDQEPDWGSIAVYEALFAGAELSATTNRKYFQLTKDDASMDMDAFSKVSDNMETSDGWAYQERGLNIAIKLNIPESFLYRKVTSLSGGEKKRVGLAAALLKQPDVLLLDEPTNHLDVDALDWLAEFLRPGNRENKDLTVLLVTHDRYFLERVCSEIVELDRASLQRYPGNYGRYLELKAERMAALDAETDRARTKLRKEAEWMSRQPKARQAKSKAREGQFYELAEKAKGRADAKQVELTTSEDTEKQKRLGGIVAEFKNAEFSARNRTLLKDFTYNFRQRDRIGIVGSNGVGKSTFLKILTGLLPLSAGTLRLGETVRVGYYEQSGLNVTAAEESTTILRFVQEAVERGGHNDAAYSEASVLVVDTAAAQGRRKTLAGKESGPSVSLVTASSSGESVAFSEKEAMKLLTRFNFPARRWQDRLGQLSGGERRRLQLLQVLAKAPNMLILDEPSNDLDLSTLTALEEYLTESYQGCLLVVSHDNFFVNRVAEHLFVFQGDGVVRDFHDSYTEYLEYRRDQQQSNTGGSSGSGNGIYQVEGVVESPAADANTRKVSLNYDERKEMNKLEREIGKIEAQASALELKVSEAYISGAQDARTVGDTLSAELKQLKKKVQEKEARWSELGEKSQ